jgi:hypothetical protein
MAIDPWQIVAQAFRDAVESSIVAIRQTLEAADTLEKPQPPAAGQDTEAVFDPTIHVAPDKVNKDGSFTRRRKRSPKEPSPSEVAPTLTQDLPPGGVVGSQASTPATPSVGVEACQTTFPELAQLIARAKEQIGVDTVDALLGGRSLVSYLGKPEDIEQAAATLRGALQ